MTENGPIQNSKKENQVNIENSVSRKIFGNINARIFGKLPEFNERGGSLKGLNSEEKLLEEDKQPVLNLLDTIGEELDIKTFKAPIAFPKHNGKLKVDDQWKEQYNFGKDKKRVLLKGENFEGCEIFKGEAFIMSPADCMTVVIKVRGKTFAMHAGRDSIFDFEVQDPENTKSNIAENILKSIKEIFPDIRNDEIFVWSGFGIAPGKHFDHEDTDPKFGEKNKLRKDLLKAFDTAETPNYTVTGDLNLQNIFVNLFKNQGIYNLETDGTFFTYSGEEAIDRNYYTNKGGDDGRNLVLIYLS